jgi:cell wall-associated NlpC family hydrolase
MTMRSDIVAYARTLIGTPFHHAARLPGVGVDCAGVLVLVARQCALVSQDFDLPAYAEHPDGRTMLAWCDKYMGARLTEKTMQPGDAVVMITDRLPQHLGVLGDHRHGGLSLIHASNTANPPRVIETGLRWLPNQRFVASYSFPGVELWGR